MGHTYRLNDDGTVEVRHNGVWLTLDEVLDLKDRQFRESREEVLALEREREAAEAEANKPKPDVDWATANPEEDEITEYSIGGGKLVTYPGRALPNSGTYSPPTITTTHTNGLVASGGWSVPKDQAYEILPKIQVTQGGITYNVATPEEAEDAQMRGASVDKVWLDEAQNFNRNPAEESFIKRIKNKLDKW